MAKEVIWKAGKYCFHPEALELATILFFVRKIDIGQNPREIILSTLCVCVSPSTSKCGCPNHDVVVVQPQTETTPYLGYIAIFTNFRTITPAADLFYPFLWISLVPSSILPSPSPPSASDHRHTPLFEYHLLPTSSPGREALPIQTSDATSTCRPPPLISGPRAACT